MAAASLLGPVAAAQAPPHRLFVDCSQTRNGDGSLDHPWNRLDLLSAHEFQPGESAALRRGTACTGALSLHGSGSAEALVRLTAWGEGPRPRIVASGRDTQAVVLQNAEYWQIDSLDIAGGNTYGLLVTGNQDKVQSHITLRNLVVHDVEGGELHNKDNGLVVFLRGSEHQRFDHVLIENVIAAHTNQWAGIMMGAGNFYSGEEGYNRDVTIRNSVAHDVYGDGIILFRVRGGVIDASTAWLIGQQPTQNVGTPNAIWTWSCTDCTVRNNESFLTESPGVDGGAYDIDWATTRNTVERNYAHDTQGYCIAVFGAGYVTHDAVVRDNVCIDNGLSPRLARLQGAIYIHTWNGGSIDGLTIEGNTIDWNPPIPSASIVNDDGTELKGPSVVRKNITRTTSPWLMRSVGNKLIFAGNRYEYRGAEKSYWTWNGKTWHSFGELQAAGAERSSALRVLNGNDKSDERLSPSHPLFPVDQLEHLTSLNGKRLSAIPRTAVCLITEISLTLDTDRLLAPEVMSRLAVLRTLAREYNSQQLQIVVLALDAKPDSDLRNALEDLDVPSIQFMRAPADKRGTGTSIVDPRGRNVAQWPASSTNINAANLGYAVRQELGTPIYAQTDTRP
ncbi:MAG TPA: right-handed parallel beta-helix repeat-containing protein [Acidobacteriaceae bacterium]